MGITEEDRRTKQQRWDERKVDLQRRTGRHHCTDLKVKSMCLRMSDSEHVFANFFKMVWVILGCAECSKTYQTVRLLIRLPFY